MRLSILQYSPVWEDRAASRERIRALTEGAELGDWLVLPEMALSGFTMDTKAAAWDEGDHAFFSALSRERRCAVTVGGVRDGRNQALVFGPDGRLAGCYDKRILFSISGEHRSYEPGAEPQVYGVAQGALTVGQLICYELRFPALAWDYAPRVNALCYIASWPAKRAGQWRALLVARAIENQCFVVGANRVGSALGLDYEGGSLLVGPEGDVLLDCGGAEGVFSADIDPGAPAAWRGRFPVLADRRPGTERAREGRG